MCKKILMVCTDNICRSAIAEAVMQKVIKLAGDPKYWIVDSAGLTDLFQDQSHDARVHKALRKFRLLPHTHRARKITDKDFFDFQYILAVDKNVMGHLACIAPKYSPAKIFLLSDFGLGKDVIKDPFLQLGVEHFELICMQCTIACEIFFQKLLNHEI